MTRANIALFITRDGMRGYRTIPKDPPREITLPLVERAFEHWDPDGPSNYRPALRRYRFAGSKHDDLLDDDLPVYREEN